jgi:lysophospholipase L1-like esterase
VLALAAGCGSRVPDPPPPGALQDIYVALGDSYTSGPSIPNVIQGACFRSDNNYPHQVAAALDNTLLIDASCAGAATPGMTDEQSTGVSEEAPQLDALTADTDLVTLGIGANDTHFFRSVVIDCTLVKARDPEGHPCRDVNTADGRNQLVPLVEEIRGNIQRVIEAIKRRAPEARILLVGYPQIVPETGTCDLLPLATEDYPFVRDTFQRLIDAQRQVAAQTGVEFVDVQAAVEGHDICAPDPWIAGIVDHPEVAAAWHPYLAEQTAVAQEILAMLP